MLKPKIGLLPFYIELYDRILPNRREGFERFQQTIARQLETRGVKVLTTPPCRLKEEFQKALVYFEDNQVELLLTLHLAYSPSLESADVLAATRIPIVVLDTTPEYDLGPSAGSDPILYNHGIHGVQDMCNLLIRNNKHFEVEAGHWEKSDVLDRVVAWAQAARVVRSLLTARVGRIGASFEGMGDFAVPVDTLRRTLGLEVICYSPSFATDLQISEEEVAAEIDADLKMFDVCDLDPGLHRQTARTSLIVRRWIEGENLSGFTFNFLGVDRRSGLPSTPFLEASKQMARGIGYAGEGDLLTAGLVGALASVFPETTFSEMFCPDWKGDAILLSHMGEVNLNLLATRPRLLIKPFRFTDVDDAALAVGRLKAGRATLVNLAPLPGEQYRLIVVPGNMLEVTCEDRMDESVRGWFKPELPVAGLLEKYSKSGGTHHLALVYGEGVSSIIARVGRLLGLSTETIE